VRYAVLSDVHGNIEALDAAFALIRDDDDVLCLGDMVGYGPNPNECVDRLRARVTAAVLGNHDVAAIDNYGLDYFNAAAREAIEWTQGVLRQDNADWLRSLGYELRTPEYLLVHGAPVNYFTYILDNPGAAEAFAATDAPLVFVGHSHIAEFYAQSPAGEITHRHMQRGGSLQLEPDQRYIVNVGSVGQPRDANPDASFALYDSDARTIEWQRYAYPIELVREKIERAHLPARLADRLLVGR
jgi:diadenosine tetraphosphatase ApaH/serine/threonine PP2A family protein phosphatase